MLFLNDPDQYEGGELYFVRPVDLELRPPSGTLVSFPATRDYLHGVRPIGDEERYTLLVRHITDGHRLCRGGRSVRAQGDFGG
ncbi:2OG-Fe(II) oxygenase [Actinophytocola sp.]|uniref:2OG-Fe(II) oxygenase n=1 Tax=Actinophytocola sp. TaxID=1872138 RepID=UPI00345C545A